MTEQYNFDSKLEKVRVDENGFLEGTAVISSAVISTYNKDGVISKEFKHPDHLFSKETMKSATLTPITNEHPDLVYDSKGKVNSRNYKKLTIGTTGESVERVGDDLVVNFRIKDSKAIEDIKGGKTGVSIGYTSNVVKERGTYKGKEYDAINTNIRINHLALTAHPRVENARLNLDSSKEDDHLNNLNNNMTDKQQVDNSEEYKKTLTELQAKYDTLQARYDSISSELESYKTEELTQQNNDSLAETVKERVNTIMEAKEYLKDKSLEALLLLSPIEIKKLVLTEAFNVDSEQLKDDVYTMARYDTELQHFNADSLKKEEALKVSQQIKPATIKTMSKQELHERRFKG